MYVDDDDALMIHTCSMITLEAIGIGIRKNDDLELRISNSEFFIWSLLKFMIR